MRLCPFILLVACERADPSQRFTPAEAPPEGMVWIPGGEFTMGTDHAFPFEGPAHRVVVEPFALDVTEVTVAAFAVFVEASAYTTEAERIGWAAVFDGTVWRPIDGADWLHPDGPGAEASPEEPVVQVSYADALAYATWAGKRLPTEAEWERAARGGLDGAEYPWGMDVSPGGRPAANLWQGALPGRDGALDVAHRRLAVGQFAPNGYGLYDMGGNVWEWVSDWFDPDYYTWGPTLDPEGPEDGIERVHRGGSYLCSIEHCRGFRVAARGHTPPDNAMGHLGFRCASDVKEEP